MRLPKLFSKHSVKVGNKRLPVRPLTLENALRLVVLLGPHLARVEEHWPAIVRAMQATDGSRPATLSAIFSGLRDEMAGMPGDMVRAMALLLDCDYAWLAGEMSAREFVDALPVLDEVNDLAALWHSAHELGLVVKYGKPGTD